MLEQHLPLARRRRVQLGRQGHLQARQIEGESDRLADPATGGVLKEQLHLGRIGGYHAQPMPERDGQVFMDERQQTGVEDIEGQMGEVLPRFGKGLGTGLAKKALSSFWTLALKPDSIATTRTGKVKTCWRRNLLG